MERFLTRRAALAGVSALPAAGLLPGLLPGLGPVPAAAQPTWKPAQTVRVVVPAAPGGTTDIQRVVIARRLGVGAREPQQAGKLGEEGLAKKAVVEA